MSTAPPDVRPFDVCGELPSGVTVLEASAGTGKTYTIAALAARYVAEGTPLDRLLLVTFGRMATSELRERVRDRLASVEADLTRVLAEGPQEDEPDPVVELISRGSAEEITLARDRLARALAGFDGATIETTHSFCQEVLEGLGVMGDHERGTTFVEDVSGLRDEVVADLFTRKWHADPPAFPFPEAAKIVRAAIAHPDAELDPPVDWRNDSPAGLRSRLAHMARAELERRKRRTGVMSFDDQLSRLADDLDGPHGDAIAARLRERYEVVLVDEFQDTDPVQWKVFHRAFGAAGSTLVLIGDPKQAIYAFRGADVYAYLEAAREADRPTLLTNWRSDQALLDAYDALFGDARLGHPEIVYREVSAARGHQGTRLEGAPVAAPLRFRVVDRDESGAYRGQALKPAARAFIARDLAADVARLLASRARVAGEPVEPRHVAVIVRTNDGATEVRDALEAAGVPAVVAGSGSVFETPAARDWLRLLEALERPSSPARLRGAVLTPFVARDAAWLAAAGDEDLDELGRRVHAWARVLRTRGVAALWETVAAAESLPARVLAELGGERHLTDLRHVAQLLHRAATRERLGATALAAWLRRTIAEAGAELSEEERSRRLQTDADAVQVLTVHRSKGLEFPIVYAPALWEPSPGGDVPRPAVFHDPRRGDRRVLDVRMDDGDQLHVDHCFRELEEQRGEDLRLLYVALTRARHQAVVWWAGGRDGQHAPLTRLLFSRQEDGTVLSAGRWLPKDEEVLRRLRTVAGRAPEGAISVEWAILDDDVWQPPARGGSELAAATFERELDTLWRRTSYSDLTAEHDAEPRVASEPEGRTVDDEDGGSAAVRGAAGLAAQDGSALRGVVSPLAGMASGAALGTFVHAVLEATEFDAPDLAAEVGARVDERLARRTLAIGDRDAVVAGLAGAIETPLGPLLGGARLRDVTRADRLDELEFELPLAGGDRAQGEVALSAFAGVLRAHGALGSYPDRLEHDPGLRRAVRGYLTGSIDLVVRVRDAGGAERFVIADHKTNWLGVPGEDLCLWHYRPAALAAEMERSHYHLQALLYSVALHRFLRWRLEGYDPETHLGGVLYLFLRGMAGPETPEVDGGPCGVWSWRPSGALVEALSDVCDGAVVA